MAPKESKFVSIQEKRVNKTISINKLIPKDPNMNYGMPRTGNHVFKMNRTVYTK